MTQKHPINGPKWDDNMEKAIALLQDRETFLFGGDIDPDSVGSMISLSLYLKMLDKQVYLVISDALGENLDYFQKIIDYNSINVLRQESQIDEIKDQIDAVVFCDTANTKLVPFFPVLHRKVLSRKVPVIEIDHHFGTDSEELTENGIKLFRKANANTEIIGELLEGLVERHPKGPNPFTQRNILLGLITGLLGDTVGGKVVPFKEDYDRWINTLEQNLKKNTRWRKPDPSKSRKGDQKYSKFGSAHEILKYLDRLSEEQEACLTVLTNQIDTKNGIGFLNLLNSTYPKVEHVCQPYDSDWFAEILGFLLNTVPEKAGKVGMVCYHGTNAGGEDCMYIKLRRAVHYGGIDLREAEDEIRRLYGAHYMGGGGHPGAVSFRVHPHDEEEFLLHANTVRDFLISKLT